MFIPERSYLHARKCVHDKRILIKLKKHAYATRVHQRGAMRGLAGFSKCARRQPAISPAALRFLPSVNCRKEAKKKMDH